MNTDTSQIINTININADLSRQDSPEDALRHAPIRFASGDSVRINVSLLNGGQAADVSGITRISLEILDIGSYNAPDPRECKCLLNKSIDASDFKISSEDSGDFQECAEVSFSLDSSETIMPAGQKWLKIVSYSSDGSRTTFCKGWIYIDPPYSDSAQVPDSPELAITKDEALAMFLSREKNLADLTDLPAARENLSVYSKAEIDSKTQNISSESIRRPRVFFKDSKALVQNNSFLNEFPASFFLRYDIDSWDDLFSSSIIGDMLVFFNTQGVIWTSPFQNCGFRFSYSAKKELSFFCANKDSTPALSRAEYRIIIDLPTGKHSLGVCVGGEIENGTLKDICFYLDGKSIGSGSSNYNTLRGNDFTTNTPLTINTGLGYSSSSVPTSCLETSYSDFLVTNFMMDSADSPYTPEQFAAADSLPYSLLDNSSSKRALICLADSLNGYQWRDISGSGNHAIIYGTPYSDSPAKSFSLCGSYQWAASTKASAYIFGDTNVIPADCKVEAFACCADGEVSISLGASSSDSSGYISSAQVGTSWSRLGEFFTGDSPVKLCATPSVAGKTVKFGFKLEKLV